MKSTTDFGPNVLPVELEIATFPVLLFIPHPMQLLKTTKHVGTSIMAPVPGPSVSSNTSAKVSPQVTANINAEGSSILCSLRQLNPVIFKPVMPIRVNRFEELPRGHPNPDLVHYVITGFRQGFTLKYQGPKVNREPRNLTSAYQFKDKLWASLMK